MYAPGGQPLQGLHHRRGAPAPGRRQRAAQADRGAAGLTCGSSSPRPSRTRSSPRSAQPHPPVPLPPRLRPPAAGAPRVDLRAGGRAGRARGARACRPRRRRVGARRAVDARPAGRGHGARGRDLRRRRRRSSASPTRRMLDGSSTRSRPATAPRCSRSSTGRRDRHSTPAVSPPTCSSGCATCRAARGAGRRQAGLLDAPDSRWRPCAARAARSGRASCRAPPTWCPRAVRAQGRDGSAPAARAALRPAAAARGRRHRRPVLLARLDRVERRIAYAAAQDGAPDAATRPAAAETAGGSTRGGRPRARRGA